MTFAKPFTSGMAALAAVFGLLAGAGLPRAAQAQTIVVNSPTFPSTMWSVELVQVGYSLKTTTPGALPMIRVRAIVQNTTKSSLPLTTHGFDTEIINAEGTVSYKPEKTGASLISQGASIYIKKDTAIAPGGKVTLEWDYRTGADAFIKPARWKFQPRLGAPGMNLGVVKPVIFDLPQASTTGFVDPQPRRAEQGDSRQKQVSSPLQPLGAWRGRVDYVGYGRAQAAKPGVVDVNMTFQNISNTDLAFPKELLVAELGLEGGAKVAADTILGRYGEQGTGPSVMVPPGGLVTVTTLFHLDSLAERSNVRHFAMRFKKQQALNISLQLDGEISTDLPPMREQDDPAFAAGVMDAAAGFEDAGYYSMRVDAYDRTKAAGTDQVEIQLTVRNDADQLRRVANNPDQIVLIGSDGKEYKWDGNYYGRSSREPLKWSRGVYKGEQLALTYVFPKFPPQILPMTFVVRSAEKGEKQFKIYNNSLTKKRPEYRMAADYSGVNAGSAVVLRRFEVRLVSLQRDAQGDWEAIIAIKNPSKLPIKLTPSDLTLSLSGVDGETRHNAGDFFLAGSDKRQSTNYALPLPPSIEMKARLWFQQSGDITPTRYKFYENYGEQKGGSISAGFIPVSQPPS